MPGGPNASGQARVSSGRSLHPGWYDLSLLVVWWSFTGGTEQLAAAVARGAREATEEAFAVQLVRCDLAGPEAVRAARGYVFCAPETLATMAGMMKDFFDRAYYPVLGEIAGRPYGSVVCAGSDGTGAVRQIERIATGWRLRPVVEPLIVCTHAQTPESILARKTIPGVELDRAAALGGVIAAGLEAGIW